MITLFNIWHYFVIGIGLLIFFSGIYVALQQQKRGSALSVLSFITLLALLVTGLLLVIVDKYTKEVKLYKLENKRNLYTEQISFSGIVRNEGDFEVGEVTLEIKLINQGNSGNSLKASSFYSPEIFTNFFGTSSDSGSKQENRPQQTIHEFVVAKNLKPGELQEFRVYFEYPPYFQNVSHFAKVYAH
jgi:hypothetical protein